MNEITDMWQLFTLTGDPMHYLKYKRREEDIVNVLENSPKARPQSAALSGLSGEA